MVVRPGAGSVPTPQSQDPNVSKQFETLTVALTGVAQATRAETLAMSRRASAAKEALKVEIDRIETEKGYIGDIIAENNAKRDSEKIARDWINTLKQHGISQKEIDVIARQLNTSSKLTTEEFKKLWQEFTRGQISYRQFISQVGSFGEVISGLSKLLLASVGPWMLVAGAVKLAIDGLNRLQVQRGFEATVSGMTGAPRIPGIDILGTTTQLTLFGNTLGLSTEETLKHAESMAKAGFIVDSVEGSMREIAEATKISIAVQKRFGLEQGQVTDFMRLMRWQVGMSTEALGGAFVRLSNSTKGTNLSVGELLTYLNQLGSTTLKYGTNIDTLIPFLRHFSDGLKAGTITVEDFSRAMSSIKGASTGQIGGLMMLTERFDIFKKYSIKGPEYTPGAGTLERVGTFRAWTEGNPTEALRAALLSAREVAGKLGHAEGSQGFRELLLNLGRSIPGIEEIAKLPYANKEGMGFKDVMKWVEKGPSDFAKAVED